MNDAAARKLADAYTVHGPACRVYARSLTGADDDAAQEAFVRLARRLAAGGVMPEHLRPWLLTAVRSAVIDARRSADRRRQRESAALPDAPLFEPGAALDAEAAERAIMSLPARQREAVTLRIWGELGFEAIARMLGVATSTAHADFNAGIAALRRSLGEREPCGTKETG